MVDMDIIGSCKLPFSLWVPLRSCPSLNLCALRSLAFALALFRARSLWGALLGAAWASFFLAANAGAASPNFIQGNYATPQTV